MQSTFRTRLFSCSLMVVALVMISTSALAQRRDPRPGASRSRPSDSRSSASNTSNQRQQRQNRDYNSQNTAFNNQTLGTEIGYKRKLGLGVTAGSYTSGATLKYFFTDAAALQFRAGFDLGYGSSFTAGIDYVHEIAKFFSIPNAGELGLYLGGGLTTTFYNNYYAGNDYNNVLFGVSFITGVSYRFWFPLEVAVEIRPTYTFGDYAYLNNFDFFESGVAARWYF